MQDFSKTKLDESFPSAQVKNNGFSASFRFDRNGKGSGILMFIPKDIPCSQLF